MRVAVYGGSFNPPHLGHALVCAWLAWTDQVDEVWLVPVADHAFGKRLAPYEARVGWCRAMADRIGPFVDVSTIESELPRPSYTLHTLRALAAAHPGHRFRLVIGADILPHTAKWHRWDDIQAGFDPIVVGRDGYESPAGVPVFPGVSSSEIRDRLLAGEPVDAMMVDVVRTRIGPEHLDHWRDAGD